MNNIRTIEKRLLKYLPKESIPYVIWLDHEYHYDAPHNTYWLVYGDNEGHEVSTEPCDYVSELRSLAKWAWERFKEKDWDENWK